ncbi:MAG: SUMF1/EgtB/PvdO family nonheme iron enzyme, partial [Anaerolineae bacterium]
ANQRRQAIVQAVGKLADALPATARLLVTARPYAYADPQWRLPSFRVLTLSPFAPEQVERFITRWYEAAAPAVGLSLADAQVRGGRLRQALQDRPYLADLASRPLLLTLMATLHSSWGELPADRADLYEETVELLLERWQRAKEVHGPDGQPVIEPGIAQVLQVGKEQIRRALQTLAYTVHRRQRAAATVGDDAADISEGEVLVAFKPLLGKADTEALLRYPRERAGLLLARRPGVYAFPHRSFQEFLAACYLADQPDATETLVSLVNDDPAWWREVAILTARKKKRGGLGDAVAVVGALIPDSPADDPQPAAARWPAVVIAGQALLELHFPEQARGQRHYQAVLRRGQQWLLAFMRSGALTPRERAEAGRTLARLGDPRVEVLTSAAMEFCFVPAGPFWMGSKDDPDADENEQPQHRLGIPYGYWIGRYPVTNAQFGEFVAAGGYREARYWREAEAAGYWIRDGFKGWHDEKPRMAPLDLDEPLNSQTHPATELGWYEALAYTLWLQERLAEQIPAGWRVRLPNEPEWEKAARGGIEIPAQRLVRSVATELTDEGTPRMQPNPLDRRRYSWGNESDANRANCNESGIGATSAVGCFPGGASVYGVEELCGNVWEWTQSLYGTYPYPADGAGRNQREKIGASLSEGRVMRNGLHTNDCGHLRCTQRFGSFSNDWYDFGGFRVVVSP